MTRVKSNDFRSYVFVYYCYEETADVWLQNWPTRRRQHDHRLRQRTNLGRFFAAALTSNVNDSTTKSTAQSNRTRCRLHSHALAMTAPTLISDAYFWARQNSASSQLDHPQMESSPRRPSHPDFELFIASPAGKPLYYFAYDDTHHEHPCYDQSATPRPQASITSLSATLTAFQEATFNRVSVINTDLTTYLTFVHNALHVVLVSRQRPAPILFLQAILRLAVVGANFCLSASLGDYLRSRPNARPSFTPVERILNSALLDAIAHPLPYSLLKPVVLSASTTPSNRNQLGQLISDVLLNHTDVSHAIMFTAGPPFPSRLIISCSPVLTELSPLDLLLLSSLPSPDSIGSNPDPVKVYPQAWNFRKGVHVVSRFIQLRLHSDHYETFKRAVGGQMWRPEWTQHPPHTVRLVTLSSSVSSAIECLDDVEQVLDRASAITSLLISMERPLCVQPFGIHGVRDVIVIKDEKRLAGSLGSFCYTAGISTLITLQNARTVSSSLTGTSKPKDLAVLKDKRAFLTRFSKWGLRVILWDSRFVILFDLATADDDEEAVRVCRDIIIPQLDRFVSFIVPVEERTVVHRKTLLAGFLAPFTS